MRYLAAFAAVFVAPLVVPVVLILTTPRVAVAADDTTVAREHFEKGKAFMDLGKYNEAAAEYEAAYAAKPDPTLLLNLAQAHRQAGNAEKALRFYRKYLQYVPKSPYRADIEDKIAALEKQVKEGTSTAPPPANNASSGSTAPAPPGTGTGQPPYSPPPPAPPPGYEPPPSGYPSSSTPPPPAGPPPAASSPPPAAAVDHGKNLKIAAYAAGGLGVVSFVLAAVFAAQAKDAAQKIETAAAAGGTFDATLQNQDSRGRSAQTKEVAFLVVGVAALAGGGVLYYFGRRQGGEGAPAPGTVALLPAASATDLGAALRVTF
jgi:tetratricopeptide (TPR) repeat protein